MNNFIQNYKIIHHHLQSLDISFDAFKQIRKPKLSNIELIAMNLTSEYMGIDSECQLFRVINGSELSGLIDRSVYNRRKRRLFGLIEKVRQRLCSFFNEFENYYVVDSMPLEVCKIARASRSTICKDEEYCYPDKGFCASQKMYYYGYKLHGVCSISGVFQSIDISPASVHDIKYLKDLKTEISNCVLLGDMGYLSAKVQLNLFETVNINLQTPMRKNQKDYQEQPYIFRKSRKRIETLFSQLCDQFMIRRNYAKSFDGFRTRILSKISALTMIQYLNKFVFDRPINSLKLNLA
ncbi:MAG: IS982 family transposase [Bacteroidetes bacterium]|nr:IS982 family transposase [Bacteroidota bacterium]|tara:strand:- start:15 stop:896 length:882 start_codon:yes stop_codon:yes gene_type:complete